MVRSAALAALLALPSVAPAEGVPDDLARLEVLPGWTTEDGTRMTGFRFILAPGWKTYWRAPGDGGIPPLFDWQGSEHVSGVRLHWPVPEVFDQAGLRSVGYEDALTIPIEIEGDGGGPMRVAGEVEIGVCEEVCVPVTLSFDLSLPAEGRRDPAIVAALIDRPMSAEEAGLGRALCTLRPDGSDLTIDLALDLPRLGAGEAVVIETGNADIWVSEPTVRREGDTLLASARMVHMGGGAMAIDRSDLRLTVLAEGRGVDIQGCTG